MGFPLNEQLPNVGRINQDYSFTIANTTYKSNSNGQISYRVENLPSWLSFDEASRTFYGKPQEENVGEFQITLIGTDSTDQSQMINNYTMLVSNDSGLYLTSQSAIFQQLTNYGQTNGINGLVVKPGDQIDLKFDTDIFESYSSSDRPIIAYYGRSQDRSSLPNWITFNSENNSFSGTAPYVTSENAPSYEYGFSFIASDYYGYAGAEGDFKIIVGGHQLSTSINETIKVNGSYGKQIDDEVPVYSSVYLDGTRISSGNISNVYSEDLPDYLQLNNITLTGQFSNTSTFDNFSIIIADVYGNQVEIPYSFNSLDSIFTISNLNDVNATRGEFFEYEILQSLFTDYNETKIDVDIDSNWLTYDESNMTLYGMTPKDFNSLEVKINGDLNDEEETKSFYIRGIDQVTTTSFTSSSSSSATSSSSTSTSSASTTTSSTTTTSSAPVSRSSKNKALAIGLGVGIPVFVIGVAAFIFLCCCLKRRKQKDQEKSFDDEATTTSNNGLALPIDPKEDSASVNVMKLDKINDSRSSTSSLTHVESSEDDYYDAQQQPVKSWRANTESDDKVSKHIRQSDASMSTVNTEQLFSVRLVDDQSYRNSNSSSQLLSSNSINGMLKRDDSTYNIQRLDSEGNIVDLKHNSQTLSNLDIVPEEHHQQRDETNGSISNLLSKFNEHTPSNSSSEHDELNVLSNAEETPKNQVMNSQLNFSNLSIGSQNSGKFRYDESATAKNNINIDKLAKLVDFTRKASLRESAHEPDYHHKEESATIHDDSD
ncbi:unnamed protein product [Candida verbasci]|uniref:Dystroglycan-type cadherin-like domain-containing protein n=1 Tax=Candida verbasci TaxID=1227364 RepID=A0A9W4XBK9_9ASCO|nr:unnamed protein product [Candida verbasci]